MCEELSDVAKQQAKLLDLVGEAAEVRKVVKEKDPVIQGSERPTDDSEQHTRTEDVIISGLETTHRSDASAAAAAGEKDAEDAAQEELQSLERQLFNFLKGKNISVRGQNVAASTKEETRKSWNCDALCEQKAQGCAAEAG